MRLDASQVDPLYLAYHDQEWGVPVHDDRRQFEFLTLESAQAGLSWWTVLNKREGYRKAFADFDPVKVARFHRQANRRLLENPAIIRNRLKVTAAVNNARRFWRCKPSSARSTLHLAIRRRTTDPEQMAPTARHARHDQGVRLLSKDLKRRGFKFVGSTIVYAHMQAVGMVNDHLVSCFRHKECARMK